jgi:hypothetical protein
MLFVSPHYFLANSIGMAIASLIIPAIVTDASTVPTGVRYYYIYAIYND